MASLLDANGNPISTTKRYKIRFADGSELGTSSGTNAGIVSVSGLG